MKFYKTTAGCCIHMKKHKNEIMNQIQDDINTGNNCITHEKIITQNQIIPVEAIENSEISRSNENDKSQNIFLVDDSVLNLDNIVQHNEVIPNDQQQLFLLLTDKNELIELQLKDCPQVIEENTETTINADDKSINESQGSINKSTDLAYKQNNILNSSSIVDENKKTANHQCEYCPKAFRKPIDLVRHIRTHTNERPYKCNLCEKSFSLLCTLKIHKRTHSTIKEKFPCNVCWHSFSSKSSLNTHTLLHTDQPNHFKCDYCSLTFRTSGHRKNHEKVHKNIANKLNINVCETKTKKQMNKLKPLLDMVIGMEMKNK